MDVIKPLDYAFVVSDKKMKDSGLVNGDLLMVTSTKVAPVKKSDPYLQRVYVLAIRVVNGEHQVPGEKNDYLQYMVDPRNLQKADEQTTKEMNAALEEQYGANSETPN